MKRIYHWLYLVTLSILLAGCASNRPRVIVITSTFPSTAVSTSAAISTPIATTAASTIATPFPTSVEASNGGQYIVRAGDTLSGIAANNNVSLELLLSVNAITNPDLLEVGQVITLPPPPSSATSAYKIVPDSRLVRSPSVLTFDFDGFMVAQTGYISGVVDEVTTRLNDGSELNETLSAANVIQRVAYEYSIDPRIFLTFLEYRANWLSQVDVPEELRSHPIISAENSAGFDRAGLYKQLSWLANELNRGYYNWKYRGATIIEFVDGTRQFYDSSLNAGTVSLQYALSLNATVSQWQADISESGFAAIYRQYFGNPFENEIDLVPANLQQPVLNLPFVQGDVWRFTGGFHGGWGSGSAWAALDFAPPDDREDGDPFCYISEYPITAVANGTIARVSRGIVVLDLDGDGNESTGWTILYLHMNIDPAIAVGQAIQTGQTLGNASCQGGFSSATHLHIARRYNGEWIPADCANCVDKTAAPAFVMAGWQSVGLQNQEYQGYMSNISNNQRVIAEQGRNTKINEISW